MNIFKKPYNDDEKTLNTDNTMSNLTSILHTRSNQLTAEMVAFFKDLDNFNKYCVNLEHTGKSGDPNELSDPLLTTISKLEKKIEVC